MKDTLNFIVTSIVTQPDKVVIEETETEEGIQLTIAVATEDMGKIIGKEGKMIRAVRNIMKIPAMKAEKRINIQIQEQV